MGRGAVGKSELSSAKHLETRGANEQILYGDHKLSPRAHSEPELPTVLFKTRFDGKEYEHEDLQAWYDEQINFDDHEDIIEIIQQMLYRGNTEWALVEYLVENRTALAEQFSQLRPKVPS